jgi:hypothetical protein
MDMPALPLWPSLDDLGMCILQVASMPTLHAVCLRDCSQAPRTRQCLAFTYGMCVLVLCFAVLTDPMLAGGGPDQTKIACGSIQSDRRLVSAQ